MMLGLLHALTACAAMAFATQQGEVVETRIPVKNTTADRMAAMLHDGKALGPEISQLKVKTDRQSNELVLNATVGTAKDVAQIVRLLDVVPKRVVLRARLVRLYKENSRVREETLTDLRTSATNDRPFSISGSDAAWEPEAQVTPRVNGDGSISIRAAFAVSDGSQRFKFEPISRRVKAGDTVVIGYSDHFGWQQVTAAGQRVLRNNIYKYGYRLELKVLQLQ